MPDIAKEAQTLVTYIEEKNVFDTLDDDGDGHTDCSQSGEFQTLIENLKHAISTPLQTAGPLIRRCFLTEY